MRQSVDVLTTTNYYNQIHAWHGGEALALAEISLYGWWCCKSSRQTRTRTPNKQYSKLRRKKSSAANRRYWLCLQGKQLTDHVKGLTVWNWTLQPPLLHISEWVCPWFWILTVKSHLAVHCEDLNSRCLFVFTVGIPHGFVELMSISTFRFFKKVL